MNNRSYRSQLESDKIILLASKQLLLNYSSDLQTLCAKNAMQKVFVDELQNAIKQCERTIQIIEDRETKLRSYSSRWSEVDYEIGNRWESFLKNLHVISEVPGPTEYTITNDDNGDSNFILAPPESNQMQGNFAHELNQTEIEVHSMMFLI